MNHTAFHEPNAAELLGALPRSVYRVRVVGDGPWKVTLWHTSAEPASCEITLTDARHPIEKVAALVMSKTKKSAS